MLVHRTRFLLRFQPAPKLKEPTWIVAICSGASVRQDRLTCEPPRKKDSIPRIIKFGFKYVLGVRGADDLEGGQQDAMMFKPSPNRRDKFSGKSLGGTSNAHDRRFSRVCLNSFFGHVGPPGTHCTVRKRFKKTFVPTHRYTRGPMTNKRPT
jgi:hypothetical protein